MAKKKKLSKRQSKCISEKIHKMSKEKKSPKQKVAITYSVCKVDKAGKFDF